MKSIAMQAQNISHLAPILTNHHAQRERMPDTTAAADQPADQPADQAGDQAAYKSADVVGSDGRANG